MAIILRPKGTTRVLGQSQGFLGLPVRDTVLQFGNGQQCNAIITAWELTPEEIGKIHLGEPLMIRMLCVTPPPMNVYVGDD